MLLFVLHYADGPSAIVFSAFLAALGAWSFARDMNPSRLRGAIRTICLTLLLFASLNAFLASKQEALLRLVWVKGQIEPPLLYEKWNSFSRIRVFGDVEKLTSPIGWGMSTALPPTQVRQLGLDIDADAATVLTAFDSRAAAGDQLEYLKYDVTNIAHYVRSNADVLVIGVGGGRDVLSALVFDQRSILGVELNENIVYLLTERFGDFTGHLDRLPNVQIVTDEARSFISRSPDSFDLIQVSLIDTWAATSSGAYVLAENSIYTVEAWKTFFAHLRPDGILSFSRWYQPANPIEMYRLASLASTTLIESGVTDPRQHIVLIGAYDQTDNAPAGIVTLLVSPQPFTDQDITSFEHAAAKLRFEVLLSPHQVADDNLVRIASLQEREAFLAQYPANLTAPRDNTPFFFFMLRARDLLNPFRWATITAPQQRAVSVLGSLFFGVIALTLLSILIPLRLTLDRRTLRGSQGFFIYFAGIGLGFMFVEISQMQRLVVFLGHPTYSLSVVLLTLLLSSSLGSYSTQHVDLGPKSLPLLKRLTILLFVLLIFGALTPFVITALRSVETPMRIATAVTILFPAGLFMGMAFPMGMKCASQRSPHLTPWLWGINGAASVCASVLAIIFAIGAGISTAFWVGAACYLVALLAMGWVSRQQPA
jgi:SAM-dependent methyltransferase